MSQPVLVRCSGCGKVLAERAGDLYVIRHRGREVVTKEPATIRCEDCRSVWTPPRRDTSALMR
jgi:uncharacterized Zn finger protein